MGILVSHWRRGAIGLLALVAAAAALTQMRPAATSDGNPYSVPLLEDTNPDPKIFEATIIAMPAAVDVGRGLTASVLTFNGTVPGPELRMKVGDTVIIHFKNQIAHNTGIHWHGIELANASDGTPLTQNQVPPNGEFLYKFTVNRPGIYWYHPHHHSSTNQVFKGLYGSLIVTDPNEAALQASGVIPAAVDTRTVVFSDVTVCKAQGSNDMLTYDLSLPHVSGAPLEAQGAPFPVTICETNPLDEDGEPRAPYNAGDVPNIQLGGNSGTVNEGQTVLTNGMNVGGRGGSPALPGVLAEGAYTLPVKAGQGLRLQMINAATTRFFRLRLTDANGTQIPLVRIGGQGGLLDNARVEGNGVVPVPAGTFDFKYDTGEILLDPGDRADVAVAIPATAAGVLTMWTEDFQRSGSGSGYMRLPTVPVMHLQVDGQAVAPYTIAAGAALRAATGDLVPTVGPATAALLNPGAFSPAKPGLASQDIQLTNAGNLLGVNGHQGSHDFSGDYSAIPHENSARYAKLGDTLELQVTNKTNAHHPFHLHGFSIQPIALFDTLTTTGTPKPTYTFPYRDFVDNINVPAQYTLRFRIKLEDRPLLDGVTPGGGRGRWVFHCHIFFHATFGMISEFNVTAPDGNERPNVNANVAVVTVDEGQTVTVQGTYQDPDNDPVTLTGPPVGTLTDNGNGTWSWSYTTTDGVSNVLYVTATDTKGLKNQTAFRLAVNNLAPSIEITSPPDGSLYSAGTTVGVVASITHPNASEVMTCSFDWDGGGATSTAPVSGGTCSKTNTFTSAGVYSVTVTVTDSTGDTASAIVMIVVFDPKAGFVSGGGTVDSPAGAYIADPNASGSATFGFYSKYRKGAAIPTGETEFLFRTGNFRFRAVKYDWLVVAGARAQFKGTGSVNGVSNYGFLLTVVDGDLTGGGGVDRFRLKVWDKSAADKIVYDNVIGAPDDLEAASPQALTSGSIIIHK
jgi:FtsP/CotA-like multicopper oxidase with cupredoxin domain